MSFPFFISFLWNNVIISIVVIFLLSVKKGLKKYTTAGFQYYIWTSLFFMLFIPFLPSKLSSFSAVYHWFPDMGQMDRTNGTLETATHPAAAALSGDWLRDFSVSVHHSTYQTINLLFSAFWIAGVLIFTIIIFIIGFKLHKLKHNSTICQDENIQTIFLHSKADMHIRRNITLYQSSVISTPISFGILHPCIILPETIHQNLCKTEIKYILMHELQHYKNMDILFNYVMCLSKIIYWINPLIWYAVKRARIDREIACDTSVLKRLDENVYMDYGRTIINYADKYLRGSNSSLALELSGNKKQIKQRISEIILFKKENSRKRSNSLLALLFVIVIVLTVSPVTSVNVNAADYYDFTNANAAEYEDLQSYFKDYDGSFVLYDLNNDKYCIHNSEQSSARVSPDSTYKIYSALFALENKIISPENTQLSWNHTDYPYAEWNQDQDINSAMKYSVSWYFQELNSRQGINVLQEDFKKIEYGNYDLSGGITDFWAESSLKISPIEQVELLTHFYHNDFQFNNKNIQTVKDALLLSRSNSAALFGKTGTGDVDGKYVNGWFVGFAEANDNTYFFATNIQNGENCNGSTAAKITMSILADKNIYPID